MTKGQLKMYDRAHQGLFLAAGELHLVRHLHLGPSYHAHIVAEQDTTYSKFKIFN